MLRPPALPAPGAVALALTVVGCGGPASTPPPVTPEPEAQRTGAHPTLPVDELGRQVVRALAAGEHEAVVSRFDETMTAAMTVDDLAEVWGAVQSQVGGYRAIASARTLRVRSHDVVVVTTEFDRGALDVRVVLDADRRITGLFIKPASRDHEYEPPAYAALDRIEEEEIRFGEEPWILPGTLTRPRRSSTPCAGLVLVHGSGPNDRDESLGPNKPFRDLALGLATRGICVLRYDKRTRTHGERVEASLGDRLTLVEETIEDAQRAARFLASQPGVDADRIFMLGHSLGGMALPRIASDTPALSGLVILAGSTRPLEDAVLDQIRYMVRLDGGTSEREREVLAKVEGEVARVKSLVEGGGDASGAPAPDQLPLGIPAAYWLDLAAHPPGPLIAEEDRPILVLHADRDYQVTDADLAGWQKALEGKPNATITRYPDLNHLFIAGEGKSTPPEYLEPGHVSPKVVEDIAAWIERQSAP